MSIETPGELETILRDVSSVFGDGVKTVISGPISYDDKSPNKKTNACIGDTPKYRIELWHYLSSVGGLKPHISISISNRRGSMFETNVEENSTKTRLEEQGIKVLQIPSQIKMRVDPSEEALRGALMFFYEIKKDVEEAKKHYHKAIRG